MEIQRFETDKSLAGKVSKARLNPGLGLLGNVINGMPCTDLYRLKKDFSQQRDWTQ
jgi:hypothetical protein